MSNPFIAFANNVNTTLAAPITAGATTIVLSSAANLPTLSSGIFIMTLNDAATQTFFEIIYVTAISGATLTVLRAQEGTAARSWLAGDYVYAGETAGMLGQFAQLVNGGVALDTSSANQTKLGQLTATNGLISGNGLYCGGPLTSATYGVFTGQVQVGNLLSSGSVHAEYNYPALILDGQEGSGQVATLREISGNLWIMVNCDYSVIGATWSQTNTANPSLAFLLESTTGNLGIVRYAQPSGTVTPWSTWPATQTGTVAPVYNTAGTAALSTQHFSFGFFTGTGGTVTATNSGLVFSGTGTFAALAIDITGGGIIGGVNTNAYTTTFAGTTNAHSYVWLAFGY